MAETEKELEQLKHRFSDLADRSWRQNLFTFTGFLSLAEQNALYEALGQNRRDCRLYGGTQHAQRLMARFGDPEQIGYEEPFPIACVRIEPLSEKFADDFSHRDFLGAILNLGIDRSAIGDIFVEGKSAWAFCTQSMAPFLVENLERVRHSSVRCRLVTDPGQMPEPKLSYREESVASARCDSVISAVWNLSRSKSLELFRQKKVYVGGRLLENNSYLLKAGETVSVRGFGKFLFQGEKHTTRKGKLLVGVDLFV